MKPFAKARAWLKHKTGRFTFWSELETLNLPSPPPPRLGPYPALPSGSLDFLQYLKERGTYLRHWSPRNRAAWVRWQQEYLEWGARLSQTAEHFPWLKERLKARGQVFDLEAGGFWSYDHRVCATILGESLRYISASILSESNINAGKLSTINSDRADQSNPHR